MKKLLLFSIIAVLLFSTKKIDAQEVKKLTFDEVIKLSEEQSPNALMAKHRFRASLLAIQDICGSVQTFTDSYRYNTGLQQLI